MTGSLSLFESVCVNGGLAVTRTAKASGIANELNFAFRIFYHLCVPKVKKEPPHFIRGFTIFFLLEMGNK